MSRPSRPAAQRTAAVARHMMSTSSAPAQDEAPVLFESIGCLRKYILNRPKKLNALDDAMLGILRPKIEDWSRGSLPGIIAGTGVGRGFCAGGDVESVVRYASNPETLSRAIEFFHREFEMDYILAVMPKAYVAVMDGVTMGGGVGLCINAPFRIATEKTMFAMPETKIGYSPDVGASYFLPRVDGHVGTYLALTGNAIDGRAAFFHGFATHYVPSRRIPALFDQLASLDNPTYEVIDGIIEDASAEWDSEEATNALIGETRVALDKAFNHTSIEKILEELGSMAESSQSEEVKAWAKETIEILGLRSPTSLKVALTAISSGRVMSLRECLQMELNIATAFCSGASPDFKTGVTAVLVEKTKSRPAWSPASIEEVDDSYILEQFFTKYSPEKGNVPAITPPEFLAGSKPVNPMRFALPTEEEIGQMVSGSHPQSGSTEITLEELLAKFENLKHGKHGVREKILEVVQRRCTAEQDKHLNKTWLKWIH
ncbi:3-hydroxyisobutyryl-coenzyme A hydrolase [Obba rivulosa]|uniref:3-hydroxyisobutyryl-CoA hydrolase n=1 Tax=Obba rivulosa TaxID=1052685 RepID=A0A8E2AX00_9APHY|nr:3-hydroxyisobutyryl-coenzyme A hydrolase [Obba rivulosa]